MYELLNINGYIYNDIGIQFSDIGNVYADDIVHVLSYKDLSVKTCKYDSYIQSLLIRNRFMVKNKYLFNKYIVDCISLQICGVFVLINRSINAKVVIGKSEYKIGLFCDNICVNGIDIFSITDFIAYRVIFIYAFKFGVNIAARYIVLDRRDILIGSFCLVFDLSGQLVCGVSGSKYILQNALMSPKHTFFINSLGY